ncbi:MAG TPA: AAA family ATPase [Kofleriaceae bacterium]|nr:AAA family ATPase [Kofleriaceae bacterium]
MSAPSPSDIQAVLDRLEEVEQASTPLNRETARSWREAIREAQAFLERRDHAIVFIGSVGVGKSSLISVLAHLLVGARPTDRTSLKERSVLAIGSGRTTVCEVQIRAAREEDPGAVGLTLEPMPIPDLEREITLYAQGEWRRRNPDGKGKGEDDSDPFSAELHRVIRNMTGYQERSETYVENGSRRRRNIRPLDEVIPRFGAEHELAAHLIERASLPDRTRTAWWWGAPSEESLQELKLQFEAVNEGNDAQAMLPLRMTVVVPRPLPDSATDLDLSLVDSRGLDGAIEPRRDLQELLRDPRAITVLCAPFKDAPGDTLRALLQSATADAELRRLIPSTLLVLLDHGDAEQVNDSKGDRELGQEIKSDECHRALEGLRLEPAIDRAQILAFDTLRDEPVRLQRAIDAGLDRLRQARSAALQSHLASAGEFLASASAERQIELREQVARQVRDALARHLTNEPLLRDPLAGLYTAIRDCRYASVVYAACRRNGRFSKLDLYAAVRSAAARAATSWVEQLTAEAMVRLAELQSDPDYQPIIDYIHLLKLFFQRGAIRVSRDYASRVGQQITLALKDDPIWEFCCTEWGLGAGFKDRVIEHLQAWSKRHELTEHERTGAEQHVPLLAEVMRSLEPPRFVLRVENLRALRHASWTPEPVTALIGANGTGKTTLLAVLRLLRLAYERSLPEAVNLVLGGSSNLRSWGAREDEPIQITLGLGSAAWQLELAPRNGSGDYLASERFLDDEREIFSRDSLGMFRYRDIQLESSRQVGLRQLIDRGVPEPALRRFAALLQRVAVFHDPDLWSLRSGSRTTDDRQLEARGANALTLLRRWHQEQEHRHRYQFVVEGLQAAFPNLISDLGFHEAGTTLVVQIYRPNHESPSPLASEANGLLQLLVLFCEIASVDDEGIVAIDEPENCLHPYALRVFLRRASRWAKQHHLTVLLATHSTVLLDELPPDQVFVMKPAAHDMPIPTRLDRLCDPEWLAEFKVGELYEQGEIGSNKDPGP